MEISAYRTILCSLLLLLPHAMVQDNPKPDIKIAALAARAEDVSSIEAIVKADYECISGGIGVARRQHQHDEQADSSPANEIHDSCPE